MASVVDENASVKVETRVSFQLGLNAADFPAATDPSKPAHMSAKLTICSTLKPALVLEFFSAQRYDAVITNGEGVAVYHWSNGRVFPQIASLVPVDGEMDWVIDIPLADDHGVMAAARPLCDSCLSDDVYRLPGRSRPRRIRRRVFRVAVLPRRSLSAKSDEKQRGGTPSLFLFALSSAHRATNIGLSNFRHKRYV